VAARQRWAAAHQQHLRAEGSASPQYCYEQQQLEQLEQQQEAMVWSPCGPKGCDSMF
jgi:hypothetical protein